MHILKNSQRILLPTLCFRSTAQISRIPTFSTQWKAQQDQLHVLHSSEADSLVPKNKIKEFQEKKSTKTNQQVSINKEYVDVTTSYFNENSWRKIKDISANTSVKFSNQIQQSPNFLGLASEILTKGYKFSRKQKAQKAIEVSLQSSSKSDYILQLSRSKIQAAEWANSRGNEATTTYMLEQAQKIADKYPGLKLKTIRGKQLLQQGFRLMHAVGRASQNQPIFVCLEWKGAPEKDQWLGLVGKGVTFDSGGLNLKPSTGISGMHNDKHGSCSVLSTMQSVASLNTKHNVVGVLGLVQNFINSSSYRPLDIIQSRKGLTVQIGNTDAEGRLVLADCMNWLQEKYKVKTMLQLSTLTGAIIIALGKQRAGLFSNSQQLVQEITKRGQEMEQLVWNMPIDEYHIDLIKPKQADLTNASKQVEGSSCQAAAFLKHFVEEGVEWAHIDIAGVADAGGYSTGYGAKLLLHLIQERAGGK